MPTVLQIRFPGRRYHATPWGHHVNEGVVEWPPSPWRLLRALLATGFTKLGWPPQGPPELARRLIQRLASVTPAYVLPSANTAHTRHYVDAGPKKLLILDTWAQVDDGQVQVVWDVELSADQRELLQLLAEYLGYLGRAESWAVARLVDRATAEVNCLPDQDGPPERGFEAVSVLCPMSSEAYLAWRAARVAPILAKFQPAPGKKLTAAKNKKLNKALAPFPVDLVAALCADTSALKAQGWSAAPGSRTVLYWRRTDSLSVNPAPAPRPARVDPVPFALLAIATASRGTSALPPLHRVFPQGRLLHTALSSAVRRAQGDQASLALLLLGRSAHGPARLNHQHAHLLYLDLDLDRRLDHVLVYAPAGLDADAQRVLRMTHRTWMKGGVGELRVALAGLGDADLFRQLPGRAGGVLASVLGPSEGSRHWVTETPFVAPRMLKKRGKDSLEGQIRLECQRRGLPQPSDVRVLPAGGPTTPSIRHFILHDPTHQPPWRTRYAIELDFDRPIQGPLCLGYGAHYGLGRFICKHAGRLAAKGVQR